MRSSLGALAWLAGSTWSGRWRSAAGSAATSSRATWTAPARSPRATTREQLGDRHRHAARRIGPVRGREGLHHGRRHQPHRRRGRRRTLHRQPHPHHPGAHHPRHKQPGDPVNLEVDVLAKYVERMLGRRRARRRPGGQEKPRTRKKQPSERRRLAQQGGVHRLRPARHVVRHAGQHLGLAALALGWRRAMLTWPAQLLSGVVLVAAFWCAHLARRRRQAVPGDRRRAVGLAPVAARPPAARDGSSPCASPPGASAVLLASPPGWAPSRSPRSYLVPALSWSPWPDAYIFVGTLAAMFAQARGLVEFWFAWLPSTWSAYRWTSAAACPSPASSTSSTSSGDVGHARLVAAHPPGRGRGRGRTARPHERSRAVSGVERKEGARP